MDYDSGKMISYGTVTIDANKAVVNREYRKLTHRIKKIRYKIQRIQALFFPLIGQAIDEPLDKLPIITVRQMEYKTLLDKLSHVGDELVTRREQIESRIKFSQMPGLIRYNKLKTEGKLLIKVIRIICYKVESSVATWISLFLAKSDDKRRMVVEQIIASNADLVPDYQNNT